MELPFAVESPERTSQILASSSTADIADDGSSLVTTSSQGSFLGSSSGTGGAFSHSHSPALNNPTTATMTTTPNHIHTTTNTNNHTTMRPSVPVLRSQPQVRTGIPTAPVPAPSTRGGGITSGLNIFGSLRVPSMPSVLSSSRSKFKKYPPPPPQQQPNTETVDFTYVNVCETDADEVDITLDGQHTAMQGLQGRLGGGDDDDDENHPGDWIRGDILSILLSGAVQQENSTNETLVVRSTPCCAPLLDKGMLAMPFLFFTTVQLTT